MSDFNDRRILDNKAVLTCNIVGVLSIIFGGVMGASIQHKVDMNNFISDRFNEISKYGKADQNDFCAEIQAFNNRLNEYNGKGKGPAYTFDCSALQPK